MNLIPYEPWNLLEQVQRELSRVLEGPESGGQPATAAWAPAVDIKEEPDRFVILADLPGLEAKDIDITMENGVLTLKGQRAFQDQRESEGYRRVERLRGSFMRRFSLPEAVEADKITAKSRHGILELVVPKAPQAQPRRIAVES